MKRPTGVTILAVLHWLEGVLIILVAGMLWWMARLAGDLGGSLHDVPGMDPQVADLLAQLAQPAMLRTALVILGLFAVLFLALGVGLWKLQNWARLTVLVLMALRVLVLVGGTLFSLFLMGFDPLSLGINLLFIVVYAWIVWYLFQPEVKRAFGLP